jgi:hypothetical protein
VEEADEELGEGLVVARIGSVPHAVHRLLRGVTPLPPSVELLSNSYNFYVFDMVKKRAVALFSHSHILTSC